MRARLRGRSPQKSSTSETLRFWWLWILTVTLFSTASRSTGSCHVRLRFFAGSMPTGNRCWTSWSASCLWRRNGCTGTSGSSALSPAQADERACQDLKVIESAEEFVRLRTSDDPDEYGRATNDEASEATWRDVIARFPEMRWWVAQNKTVPLIVLETLRNDPEEGVRSMVRAKGVWKRAHPADFKRLGDAE